MLANRFGGPISATRASGALADFRRQLEPLQERFSQAAPDIQMAQPARDIAVQQEIMRRGGPATDVANQESQNQENENQDSEQEKTWTEKAWDLVTSPAGMVVGGVVVLGLVYMIAMKVMGDDEPSPGLGSGGKKKTSKIKGKKKSK